MAPHDVWTLPELTWAVAWGLVDDGRLRGAWSTQLLSELCTHAPVDVMPGARDPANYMQPQQPLFRGLFPVASTLSTFSPVTNPHAFVVNGVRCVERIGL